MEGSGSLAFRGSILEAINEAKRQKKLFVVYISGDNPESKKLESATWTDTRVAESVSKYCILLQISEDSIDAVHFSALYPQKNAPCITAIGYNGVQLWQQGGFVSAEVLASTIEKQWLSLHIQETTAAYLSTALASKSSEQLPPVAPNTEQASSSRTNISLPPAYKEDENSSDTELENAENMGDSKGSQHGVEMEGSGSLAFRGSIPEAINEAKRQKKLFVVYISGDNPESKKLESATWMDTRVAESVSKYCILLQISEDSIDAVHFSALYPQKNAPCITAIGYNGVQLWQQGGFVSAEVLASTIEKQWLSLHIQETTAAYLSTALASKSSEQLPPVAPNTEQASSSRTNISLSPAYKEDENSSDTELENAENMEDSKGSQHGVEEINSKMDDESSLKKVVSDEHKEKEVQQPVSSSETVSQPATPVKNDANDSSMKDVMTDNVEVEITHVESASTNKSNDVHLNIRLLEGASLQQKFSVTSNLGMVKDYVDENQGSSMGSYDLAISYPRKVFTDQELSMTLSELGLFNRQALMVVPRPGTINHHKKRSSSTNKTNLTDNVSSSNESNEGYFAYMRRMLSYVNPFSYIGGGSSSLNSSQETESSMWQYRPNPNLQNNLRGTGRPYTVNSPEQTGSGSNSKSRQLKSSPFGSNIHTLKHDEDDDRFSDRNAFWNGNSTQYGGDNDGK